MDGANGSGADRARITAQPIAGPGGEGPKCTDDAHQPAHNCHKYDQCDISLESFHRQLGQRQISGSNGIHFVGYGNKSDQPHLDLPVDEQDLFVLRIRNR